MVDHMIFSIVFEKDYKTLRVSFSCQSFPVMVGDMDNTGSLNAQVIHQLADRLRSKVAMQVRAVTNMANR